MVGDCYHGVIPTAMYYSPNVIKKVEDKRRRLSSELKTLVLDLLAKVSSVLTVDRSREYLAQGVCRRLNTIGRCIENIFSIFPMEREQLLGINELNDLNINLHAFVLNVDGLQDNLAWVYVFEKGLEKKIRRGRRDVSLFNASTSAFFPEDVRTFLGIQSIRNWHERYAKNYRDALSHRIPLYVSPMHLTSRDAEKFNDLERQIWEQFKADNIPRSYELRKEQTALGKICAAFAHSHLDSDRSGPVVIHPQVISDTITVVQIINVFFRNAPWI